MLLRYDVEGTLRKSLKGVSLLSLRLEGMSVKRIPRLPEPVPAEVEAGSGRTADIPFKLIILFIS